jgi:hypothetical protein
MTADAPLDAAIACAWDSNRYYYWMSTRRRHSQESPCDKPHPDAIKLLIVNAMAHAKSLNLLFDVCGFNTPGAQKLYKELLRVPNEENRDLFERLTIFLRLYRTIKRRLVKLTAFQRAKGMIRRAAMAMRRPSAPFLDC